jgi:hypothetical protein
MPAGYARVWLSVEAAIDHIIGAAGCGRQDALEALVQAILDGEIRSRFGDNGLQEIKAFLWENARRWAPYSGFGGRYPHRVRISGDAAYLRPYFDPPPDLSLLPERMRPVEIRREDLERLWPSPSASAESREPLQPAAADTEAPDSEERLARKWRRRKWRRQWIAKFAVRQRTVRRWIAVTDLADWCAQSTTTASIDAEARARELAYRRLTESVQRGEFEREGRSKVLYLDTLVTSDGASPRCRLTREQFEVAYAAAATPPAPSLPITVLNCCWLPSDMARRWLDSHGYRWAPHFEPAQGRLSVRAIPAFDLRLGWIPLGEAFEIIGTNGWAAVKQAIQREALRGRCRADGIVRDLKPHWLDFLAFDRPDEDVLWFDREKVWRARTRDASLEPVPDRASEIVLSLAQCRELWPDRAWPEAGHPADKFASGIDPLGNRVHPFAIGDTIARAVSATGMPGRPSKGKHLIEDEFKRRCETGEVLASLDAEAQALLVWYKDNDPSAQRPTVKTIKNNIRASHRKYLAERSDKTTSNSPKT